MTRTTECSISKLAILIKPIRAYKRKKRVVMKKIDSKTNKTQERFWLCFTHPEEKDANDNYIP